MRQSFYIYVLVWFPCCSRSQIPFFVFWVISAKLIHTTLYNYASWLNTMSHVQIALPFGNRWSICSHHHPTHPSVQPLRSYAFVIRFLYAFLFSYFIFDSWYVWFYVRNAVKFDFHLAYYFIQVCRQIPHTYIVTLNVLRSDSKMNTSNNQWQWNHWIIFASCACNSVTHQSFISLQSYSSMHRIRMWSRAAVQARVVRISHCRITQCAHIHHNTTPFIFIHLMLCWNFIIITISFAFRYTAKPSFTHSVQLASSRELSNLLLYYYHRALVASKKRQKTPRKKSVSVWGCGETKAILIWDDDTLPDGGFIVYFIFFTLVLSSFKTHYGFIYHLHI